MSKPKLIPRLFGGLGNQLFIYSAARRLTLVNNAELVLDDVSGFAHDTLYQRHYHLDHFNIHCRKATSAERLEPFGRLRRRVLRRWSQHLPFGQRRYLVQEGIDFDPRLLNFKPRGTVYLEGYWQGEDYFKDVESQIRADLRMRPPTDTVNQQMAERIRATNAAAVHVRFFDAPTSSAQVVGANNAPEDYYQRAIKVLDERVPKAHYYIFSDQPQAARARIPLHDDRVTLVNHNHGDAMAYADLWLMSQCRHFIIANSTFSWWGAWLSEFPEKIVIAPGFQQRTGIGWGFVGLLPNRWIRITI